jgi:hypothetical protein
VFKIKKQLMSSTKITVAVPKAVTEKATQLWNLIYDKDCPFASIYIWIAVLLCIYYTFFLPSVKLNVSDDSINGKSVDGKLRVILVVVTLISAVIGRLIIRKGCETAGSGWAVLWFIVAVVVSGVIAMIILAAAENITIPNAGQILKQLSGNKIRTA